MKWLKSNKHLRKSLVLIGISLLLMLIGYLVWIFHDSYYEIFHDTEDKFVSVVKEYYEHHYMELPRNNNDFRDMTYLYMIENATIDPMYVPKKNELCDTSSYVRVIKNDTGEYEYQVYLKCGKYESKIDHTKPMIELNGNDTIYLSLNDSYTELGVKKVIDDQDKNLSEKDVVIDSSKVNTTKIGTYPVTYRVIDSSYNEAVVTRNVVVNRNLTHIVKDATDQSNYYKGDESKNYLLYSGMLFRIINVNEDGSIKVISADSVSNLRYDSEKYQGSNVEEWLNNIFYKSLSNTKDYLTDTTFCVGQVSSVTDSLGACSEEIKAKVGLLSINDYYNTVSGYSSAATAHDGLFSLVANKMGNRNLITRNFTIIDQGNLSLFEIQPVITLKANLVLQSGDGSYENPYKLNDYSFGSEHDEISTRLIGEYVTFSGQNFRIIDKDKEGNIKVIGTAPLTNNTENGNLLYVKVDGMENYEFNTTDSNSPGYVLNNDFIEFLDDSKILSKKYDILTNVAGKKYTEYDKSTITAKLVLASTTDLFSGINNNDISFTKTQLFLDRVAGNNLIFAYSLYSGTVEEIGVENYDLCAVRIVMHLRGNQKIKSGNGTVTKPYILG